MKTPGNSLSRRVECTVPWNDSYWEPYAFLLRTALIRGGAPSCGSARSMAPAHVPRMGLERFALIHSNIPGIREDASSLPVFLMVVDSPPGIIRASGSDVCSCSSFLISIISIGIPQSSEASLSALI